MASVDEIVEWVREHADVEVLPWQRDFLERVLSGEPLQVMQRGRMPGRAHVERLMKDAYRQLGYEIVERRGCWTAVLPPSVVVGEQRAEQARALHLHQSET